jgi:histidine ammonia-lyase
VLEDALTWVRRDLENEINSANDNPLVDPRTRRILHGGHFYGGHVGFAMDALKLAVASVADLLDRQLALLVDARYSQGLPANLAGGFGADAALRHGFKALQISCSAWTAEALKLTMPATAFSRSTECHNQDKVSMGTIAARDCLRVLELGEQVVAALLLAGAQGVALRAALPGARAPSPAIRRAARDIEAAHGRQGADRELDLIVEACVERLRNRRVPVAG